MTTGNSTENQALVTQRSQQLQSVRDQMEPGAPPRAIVPRTFAEAYAMCEALARADLVPKAFRGKPADMTLVVMTGAEVGIPPMAALRLYTTWDGTARLMAEGMRGVLLSRPDVIEYFEVESCDETQATWVGKRRGRPEKRAKWTIERAKRAGLLNKENWSRYPEDMLNARASMQLARMLAPDIVAGMVSHEEAQDGDVIDAQFVEAKPATCPSDFGPTPEAVAKVAEAKAAAANPTPTSSSATPQSSPSTSSPKPSGSAATSAGKSAQRPPGASSSAKRPADPPPSGASSSGAAPKPASSAASAPASGGADPTGSASSTTTPSLSTESDSSFPEKTSSGADEPSAAQVEEQAAAAGAIADDFDPVDQPVKDVAYWMSQPRSMEAAEGFLAACSTMAELDANKKPWIIWSTEMSGIWQKDPAAKGNSRKLSEMFGKRKAELVGK